MKLADPAWVFESPGSIPNEVVTAFQELIGKIAGQAGDAQDIFEHFKSHFAAAHGATSTWRSSSVGWSESDMHAEMQAAAENAPLFINAFADACESLRRRDVPVPPLKVINRILKDHGAGYAIDVGTIVSDEEDSGEAKSSSPGKVAVDISPKRSRSQEEQLQETAKSIDAQLSVFLCHSSSDKGRVRELYDALSQDGFSPWLDEVDLIPGQDWESEIRRAVRQCHVVLVCLSVRAISRTGFVQKEIKLALDAADERPEGTIFIIPVRLEKCDVPERLRRWHWVDLFSSSGYKKLVGALKTRAATLDA